MMVSNASERALEEIAQRERDVLKSFTPAAVPERSDVALSASSSFSLDPLSVSAPPGTYFITADGRGRQLYTRDGSFALREGALVDESGKPVMGFAHAGSPLEALHADPVDEALGFMDSLRIAADGSVVYDRVSIDPQSGEREVQTAAIGKIALARFPAATKLQAVDARHVAGIPGLEPHTGTAGDGNFARLGTNSRENSGVDMEAGLLRLQEAYVAFDALRAAGKTQGGMAKTAMDLLK